MSWSTKRIKLGACTVGALTAAVLAVSTTPAAASGTFSGRAYVYGAGIFSDDWGDEGVLSTSTHTYSNATCLWQKILWADGYLPYLSDVDGIFGSKTKSATQAWQRFHQLNDDGVVGKATFSMANGALLDNDKNGTVDTFDGYKYKTSIWRDSEGRYAFYDGDGQSRLAGYDYRTCS
ncbi:peptidoglycan-binding protein [Streptomyces sp. NPDC001292]|uniref:peptidoglycan-binding domain-containing protein n=1 Tax=Streptomyces sp. NPDC001292 TaxID=3364558 RepID=UPI0036D160FB